MKAEVIVSKCYLRLLWLSKMALFCQKYSLSGGGIDKILTFLMVY